MGVAYSGEDPPVTVESGIPAAIRDVREAIWGLAGFALAYPMIMGVTCGGKAAAAASAQFCVAWALGLLGFGFAEGARGVRALTLILAIAQAIVGWYAIGGPAPIPPAVAVVAACYSLGTTAAVVHLPRRPEVKVWFGARER
ncbi:hypothetical protein AB0B25_06095 [Nocardia sp. NPDC049190]|uniref:hypothetical protein n=1 Tax=Nocardia sp. NPDC049190 TaxID=3155650 RepID=UPI0033C5609D